MSEVDRNHDGKIQYDGTTFKQTLHRNGSPCLTFCVLEFRSWVEKAERQLFLLFRAIDKDGNGKLDMAELRNAYKGAGLAVSNAKLDHFFQDMDDNHDGYISFDEWRLVGYISSSRYTPAVRPGRSEVS